MRVIPLLEGVRARLDSTQTHFENRESTLGKFVDLMLLMYVVILVFMLMVFMLFMCVVCVSFTGVITLAGVSIMLEVIAAFELRFGDGTHLCQMREGPGKQPCGYTSVQVAAAFLDARNLPCNCPQIKSPKAGMFCVTCSSTSSMKTVSLPLVLRLEPADLGRRRHGSPDAPP